MSKLFISDLHLTESRPDIANSFINFVEKNAAGADELYILGDFFEAWLGDDHQSALNQAIIEALAKLSIKKFIMHGNRDFLLGASFCKQIGATLLNDPTVIEINNQSVLLMHGDSLCTQDHAYMKARAWLRSEAFQQDILSKSLSERAAFALSSREKSKARTRESASDIMDVTPSEVVSIMQSYGVRTLIHGHTHRPKVHNFYLPGNIAAQRFVLGDWDEKAWYIECDETGETGETGLNLQSFAITPA